MGQPDPYQLAHLADEFCLAESPDGYLCSEDPNHDGDHRADFGPGSEPETWPQEDLM